MLVYFTDVITKKSVAINPEYVTAVFEATEEQHAGKTVIGLVNGNLLVEDSQLDVVGTLNGAL